MNVTKNYPNGIDMLLITLNRLYLIEQDNIACIKILAFDSFGISCMSSRAFWLRILNTLYSPMMTMAIPRKYANTVPPVSNDTELIYEADVL